MKKRLALCMAALLLMASGCAELPSASYADGSPQSGGGEAPSETATPAPASAAEEPSESSADDPDALRICLDVGDNTVQSDREIAVLETLIAGGIQRAGGPENIVFDSIPFSGSERTIAQERIRTALMAGEGPDVFIVTSLGGYSLFPVPEKAMREGLFLPLDAYIQNAELSEWDRLTPVVMEAGRTEEGQQLVPMLYTLPVTMYPKSSVAAPPEGTTWRDMLADETNILRNAAAMCGNWVGSFAALPGDGLLPALGELADYETGELLFSEEELLSCTETLLALEEELHAGGLDTLPDYLQGRLSGDLQLTADSDSEAPIKKDTPVTMIPIYSDDGGVTAMVQAYTGVNRNTRHPEDAFFVVDYLMSVEAQQELKLYTQMCRSENFPVHEEILSAKYPQQNFLSFSDENFEEISRVRNQISRVYFENALTRMVDVSYYMTAQEIQAGEWTEQTLEELVSESYATMKQMLSE